MIRASLVAIVLLTAVDVAAQTTPPADRYAIATTRLQSMAVVPLPEWRYHQADLPHPEDPAFDDSGWTSFTVTAAPSTIAEGWYRRWIENPQLAGGRQTRDARVYLVLRLSSSSRVFVNGSLVAQGNGRLVQPILLAEGAAPGQRLLIAINTGRLSDAHLSIEYPGTDPGRLRGEILSTEALLSGFPNAERQAELDRAVQEIDFAALDRGDQQTFGSSLRAAERDLQPLHDWMKQFSVLAVGNSHIDMAWLWPWTETVEVVRDTYTTALQLMREYPRFTYTQSSAQTFQWLEEKYPDLFRQIQQRVREGRWEIVGGMWVEPDLNMPDGEGLVRQLLVGTRYFHQKFGVDINIGWNPDSFGYNWQLPQIYKKSGFDFFVTQKISWNDTTAFPYKLFWWQAPDGSRVLTYFPHRYDNGIDPVGIARDLADYVPATGVPELMHLYGVGDHGGGPTRAMLDEVIRLQDPSVAFPQIAFSTPHAFFGDLQKRVQSGDVKPPVWNDELYLEYHRGCYTTQSETKRQIRESEELLQNAEKFAALSFLDRQTYPQKVLEDSWKRVLFDHFHDIMPGSGVAVNYLDAARNLRAVTLEGDKILRESLQDIAGRADTTGEGIPVVVFNPLSWERTEPVVIEAQFPTVVRRVEARDGAGRALLSQPISSDGNRAKLRVLVPHVPPLGYEVIHLVPVKNARAVPSPLKVSGTTIENEFLRLTMDRSSGCITSLVSKIDGREGVAPGGCANLLQAFVDKPLKQDAWEIKFDEQFWDLKQPQDVQVTEKGPVRAVVRVKHKFQSSTFIQDISVTAGVPRVDVDMSADWHEQHILLKVGVPVSVQTTAATFEIPYGTIQRPTTRNTPAEKAKFEVPALRWGDLSDENHGLSLLNASKYGYDALGNTIRMSLLRAATYPGPNGECCTDQGFHEFRYALYPHRGNWKAGRTMQQGYEVNYPLIAVNTTAHSGSLPPIHAFARLDQDNVILTVLKKAEDDDALIFRFYEFAGSQSRVRLHLPQKAARAFETNLMEKQERPLPIEGSGRTLVVSTGPYEIKTVEVFFPH